MAQKTFLKKIFTGFDTQNRSRPNTKTQDIDLVKRDLMNHFLTRRGERLMRPEYGSIIWDLLFEPFDELIRDTIISDAERIIASDSRVELQNIDVIEVDHGIRINIALLFHPYNALSTFSVDFDKRNSVVAVSEFE